MKIKYIQEPGCNNNSIIIKAMKSSWCSKGEEIGNINVCIIEEYAKIEGFCVKEKYREIGIGKNLLKKAIEQLREWNIDKIIVYPNSEDIYEDKMIQIEKLYEIYRKLGFDFEDKNEDVTKTNNKMIYII